LEENPPKLGAKNKQKTTGKGPPNIGGACGQIKNKTQRAGCRGATWKKKETRPVLHVRKNGGDPNRKSLLNVAVNYFCRQLSPEGRKKAHLVNFGKHFTPKTGKARAKIKGGATTPLLANPSHFAGWPKKRALLRRGALGPCGDLRPAPPLRAHGKSRFSRAQMFFPGLGNKFRDVFRFNFPPQKKYLVGCPPIWGGGPKVGPQRSKENWEKNGGVAGPHYFCNRQLQGPRQPGFFCSQKKKSSFLIYPTGDFVKKAHCV